jgi:hypothetical protein
VRTDGLGGRTSLTDEDMFVLSDHLRRQPSAEAYAMIDAAHQAMVRLLTELEAGCGRRRSRTSDVIDEHGLSP